MSLLHVHTCVTHTMQTCLSFSLSKQYPPLAARCVSLLQYTIWNNTCMFAAIRFMAHVIGKLVATADNGCLAGPAHHSVFCKRRQVPLHKSLRGTRPPRHHATDLVRLHARVLVSLVSVLCSTVLLGCPQLQKPARRV
jgi:hypothetical protein